MGKIVCQALIFGSREMEGAGVKLKFVAFAEQIMA